MKDFYMYLAGPMSSLKIKEAKGWREYVRQHLPENVHCLSPLRNQVGKKETTRIHSEYSKSLFCNSKSITTRDRNDLLRSDIVFVNLLGAKRVSIGTCIEFGQADIARKIVVTVMDENNIHKHPILKEISSFIVKDLKTGIKVVRSILDV